MLQHILYTTSEALVFLNPKESETIFQKHAVSVHFLVEKA